MHSDECGGTKLFETFKLAGPYLSCSIRILCTRLHRQAVSLRLIVEAQGSSLLLSQRGCTPTLEPVVSYVEIPPFLLLFLRALYCVVVV